MVEGQLYRNGSSGCQAVCVTFEYGRFNLRCSASKRAIELENPWQFSVSDKLGNTPRQVSFANGDELTLPSNEQVDGWLKTAKGESGLGVLEKSKRMTLMALLLVPLTLFATYRYAIPQAAIYFADLVPASVSKTASQQTMATLDRTVLDPSEIPLEQQQAYIQQWSQTIKQLPLTVTDFNIQFRQSETFGANAFALPDGTIVFTDAMVELVEQNEQLLLAILLHEIGHVERKHSMRLVAQSIASALVINYVFGDFSGVADLLAGSSTALVQNSFSQQLEWEADNFALEQLDTLNLPRDTFAEAMEKLAETVGEESELTNLLSSHPLMKQRIDNARKQQNIADE